MAWLAGREHDETVATSRRPVWAIGLLLILEVVGLAALGAYEFLRVDWRRFVAAREAPPENVVEALALILLAPAAGLTLLAAMSLLLLRRRGWLMAAISQGLVVGTCLWLYVEYEPLYVYPIMAYAVLMILYLNVNDVRTVFYPGERTRGPRRVT